MKQKVKFTIIMRVIILVVLSGILISFIMSPKKQNKQSRSSESSNQVQIEQVQDSKVQENTPEESIDLTALYQHIGLQNIKERNAVRSETDRVNYLVQLLGEAGYCAVDYNNQINMVNYEIAEQFCSNARKGNDVSCTIFQVLNDNSLCQFDIRVSNSNMEVKEKRIAYGTKEEPFFSNENTFQAKSWNYTEGGYLFIEEYRPEAFDGSTGHIAIRVKPIDKESRDYLEKYIRPIGYQQNNMFTTNWSKEDYRDLCFDDLFEPLYEIKHKSLGVPGIDNEYKEYRIPQKEFEEVFQTFFDIRSSEIQKNAEYHRDEATYAYRLRGMFDASASPITPYPEVVSYQKKNGNRIVLRVNAVLPAENIDCAFTHEVTIKEYPDGNYQYLSNKIITPSNIDDYWYAKRLTKEEWDEIYGNMNDTMRE